MHQGAAYCELGGLAKNQALILGELPGAIPILPEVSLDRRQVTIDDAQTSIEKKPVSTGQCVPDLSHLYESCSNKGMLYHHMYVGHLT